MADLKKKQLVNSFDANNTKQRLLKVFLFSFWVFSKN